MTVPAAAPRTESISIHGHRVCYRMAGEGPLVLLVHGIASTLDTWDPVFDCLAEECTVLAPDLPGCGTSEPPAGDHSLGAHASGLRDLLTALGHEHATFVGHSLGGGIVMQAAYQHPELCERLVLVSSGGLGTEVNSLLRAATLPGSELVMPVVCHEKVGQAAIAVTGLLRRLGVGPHDLQELARSHAALADPETRRAFIHTARQVIDRTGQRVSATDRLYLAADTPSLIMWGESDRIIPADHGRSAHEAMPHSRLELFEGAGHYPHQEDPERFCDVLLEFVATTEPARLEPEAMRERILAKAAR